MTEYIVYQMDFPNGMKYIGSHYAGSFDDYWSSSKPVERWIAENGTAGIVRKVLCKCADKQNLNKVERHYHIANNVDKDPMFFNKRIQPDNFVHIDKGVYKHSQDTIEKMRKASTGFKHTPEARAKMSASAKRRGLSPERQAVMHAASAKVKRSPQARKNISISKSGSKNPQSKLTEDDVMEMHKMRLYGYNAKQISQRMPVGRCAVWSILKGKNRPEAKRRFEACVDRLTAEQKNTNAMLHLIMGKLGIDISSAK